MSVPYPEPGVRLIRQDQIETFNAQLEALQQDLEDAVEQLDRHYEHLKSAARNRLGSLHNPTDYPVSLQGLFQVAWDYPSVEPPAYLAQLSPELYQQECERVTARFDEAVQLAEQAFTEELQAMVSHLTECLAGQADCRPKVFRDSAIENLTGFFQRFRQLNVRSNDRSTNWSPVASSWSAVSNPRRCETTKGCVNTSLSSFHRSRTRWTRC